MSQPHYAKFVLDDGTEFYIETRDEPESGGMTLAGAPTEEAAVNFEKSLDNVQKMANKIPSKLRNLADRPDEIEVKFGLKASGKIGGFVIAEVGAEASYEITLKWRNSEGK